MSMGKQFKTIKEKMRYINQYLEKLIVIAKKATSSEKYNLALSALHAYCRIQYSVNQIYTDDVAEDLVLQIAEKIVKISNDYKVDEKTVLFYDGFGLDLRGWAAAYVRALVKCGYHLVYVTNSKMKDQIPHILFEMKDENAEAYFIDMEKGFENWIQQLNYVFTTKHPKSAFFYTTPYDVAATVVFDMYKGIVNRYQIDLTDHAFWIGINASDYFLESRIPGASNAIFERGVSRDKIISIDCCLYINRDKEEIPLPFDIINEKYIFSGGSLYKTFGDDQLLFYKVLDEVLKKNSNIKFLYAGEGDTTEIRKLSFRYPDRVFYIHERKDFYILLENCEFMWNTYPMFGGLMMRLSANAGKIPVTLKHGKDHEGLLKNQSELDIEFDTYEEVITEMNRLLVNNEYKKKKEKLLEGAVLTEEEFARNLKMIIEEQKSEFIFEEIPHINTDDFRRTYMERMEDPEFVIAKDIVCKNNIGLSLRFPRLIFCRVIYKIKRRIK